MGGMFNTIPPSMDDRMPTWDINIVLRFLLTDEFCPPESASFLRLEQKTFFLFLLATSRRLHEICSLSIRFFEIGDRVLLYWPHGFRAKNHNEDHAPAPPSIKKMSVSLCGKYWARAKEMRLESLSGNKCFYTLERHYLKKAPKLKLACSVPLGTAPPRDD